MTQEEGVRIKDLFRNKISTLEKGKQRIVILSNVHMVKCCLGIG
jgi:hypothetical protein